MPADLGADGEPISKGMIFSRATAHGTSMKQGEYALEALKDKGAIYQPPEAAEDEYMLSD